MPQLSTQLSKGLSRIPRLMATLLIVITALVGVSPMGASAQGEADAEQNKQIVVDVAEVVYNQRNFDAVGEYYAPGYIEHARDGDIVYDDAAAVQAGIEEDIAPFPDFHISVEDLVAEGDRVVARYKASANGGAIAFDGIYIARLADGKIVEDWEIADDLSLMTQLGLITLPEQAPVEPETIATGFNGPMGVLVDPEGNIWVSDSGLGGDTPITYINVENFEPISATIGNTARIVMIAPDGAQTEVVSLPSIQTGVDFLGAGRLALLDGVLYATEGHWMGNVGGEPPDNFAAILRLEDGQVSEVFSSWAAESADNPDGYILETHPYGLSASPDGMLWMADASGNHLVKVDPATGDYEIAAVFEPVEGVFPHPVYDDQMLRDAVPTAVAFGPNGEVYASILTGFPFLPGTAIVYQINEDGTMAPYATGLTMLTDLRMGPDGNLYAVQFGVFTDQGPQPNSGAIIRVHEGDASEVVVSGLSFPTSVDFDADGNGIIAINGVGAPGSGEVVKVAGLSELPGMPMSAAMPAAPAAPALPETAYGPAVPQDKGYLVEEISDGLYWVTDGSYQAMFLTTGEGVIVVDAPPNLGQKLLDAIAEVTDEPVTHVIYSHAHADHIGSAGLFPADATYIAHASVAEHLAGNGADDPEREMPFGMFLGGGPVPLPTETFEDSYTLEVGDQVLQLDYLGPNHSDGNTFIYAPKQKVLMLVDVIFPGWVPFRDLALATDVAGFIEAHDQALSYDFDTFVGGHLTRVGTREDVETQQAYIMDVRANTAQALQTVDFFAIAQETGFENQWLLFGTYLDAVAQACADATLEEWGDKLGGAQEFTLGHCARMVGDLRIN